MGAYKGFEAVKSLALRAQAERGGNKPQKDQWDRSKSDSLALWRDAWLENLAVHNYTADTIEGQRNALKVFLDWAAERDLKQAVQVTRPILQAPWRKHTCCSQVVVCCKLGVERT